MLGETMMDTQKISQLNQLFEKMMADEASREEQFELKHLYSEYINDGRDNLLPPNTIKFTH